MLSQSNNRVQLLKAQSENQTYLLSKTLPLCERGRNASSSQAKWDEENHRYICQTVIYDDDNTAPQTGDQFIHKFTRHTLPIGALCCTCRFSTKANLAASFHVQRAKLHNYPLYCTQATT